MDGQQSARVNIDDRDWIRFRIRAMRHHRSIADYLGDLVRTELATRDTTESDEPVNDDANPPPAPTQDRTGNKAASKTARGERIRLSDVELLTLQANGPTSTKAHHS